MRFTFETLGRPKSGLLPVLLPGLLLVCACARPDARLAVPVADGHDCATAMPVESVREEYVWIKQNRPGARLVRQSLISCKEGNFPADLLEIRLPDGTVKPVYFNITKVMEGYQKLLGK